ncbi:hypothetical protein [Roseibium album]|uniref:hypothetical protein n=1 Tax=Roseibium album TaxID=311410 RepID=UPI002493359C|nr:hypothetical protein [Roseibium album]
MADFEDITGWREELEVFEESEEGKAYFRQHLNDRETDLPFDVVLELADLMLKHKELRDAVRQRAEFRAFLKTRPDLTNDDDEFWKKNPLEASETLAEFMAWYGSKTRVPFRGFPLSKDTKENRRTGSDWLQGGYDEDGYGPRMTLSYDDEAGERRVVTESFQANVDRAWQRSRMTHMARLWKKAEEFGLTHPKQSEAEAKPMVPETDPNPTNIPVPQAKPAPGIHVHDTQTPEA